MGPALSLCWEGSALGGPAVNREADPMGRDQYHARAMGAVRVAPRDSMTQERLTQVVPGQDDLFIAGVHRLGPGGPEVPRTPKLRFSLRNLQVAESRVHPALKLALEPTGHLGIVGVNPRLIVSQFALDEERMAGSFR